MALTLEIGLGLAYGAITVALAGVFYFSGPANRTNHAFTFFLFILGMGALLGGYANLVEEPVGGYWRRVGPYFGLLQPITLGLFLSVYPRRRKWVPSGPLGWLPFLVAIILMDGLYAIDHANFIDVGATENGLFGPVSRPGPVLFLFDLFVVTFAIAPLILMRDYARTTPGPARRAILFVAMGVTIVTLYVVAYNQVRDILFAGSMFATGYAGTSFDHPYFLLSALVHLGLRVALVAYLIHIATRHPDSEVRRGGWVFLALIAAIVTSVLAAAATSGSSFEAYDSANDLIPKIVALARDVFIIYALLRYQLFDIDIKIKLGIRRGTVAALFLAIFFIVAQVAQTFLTQEYGLLLGGAAAGLMLFFLAPLQRFAERVSEAALPGVKPLDALSADERGDFYLEQARLAWADGGVDRSERLMLDRLRERLGLSHEDTGRLEVLAAKDAPSI